MQPKYRVIADFRKDNIDALNEEDIKPEKEKILKAIEALEGKINEYTELEKILEEQGVNEVNLSDADARTVKFGSNQGTDVGYDVQTVVDSKNKLIATFEVSNDSADQSQLCNMSSKAKEIFNVETIESLADKGYFDSDDLKK